MFKRRFYGIFLTTESTDSKAFQFKKDLRIPRFNGFSSQNLTNFNVFFQQLFSFQKFNRVQVHANASPLFFHFLFYVQPQIHKNSLEKKYIDNYYELSNYIPTKTYSTHLKLKNFRTYGSDFLKASSKSDRFFYKIQKSKHLLKFLNSSKKQIQVPFYNIESKLFLNQPGDQQTLVKSEKYFYLRFWMWKYINLNSDLMNVRLTMSRFTSENFIQNNKTGFFLFPYREKKRKNTKDYVQNLPVLSNRFNQSKSKDYKNRSEIYQNLLIDFFEYKPTLESLNSLVTQNELVKFSSRSPLNESIYNLTVTSFQKTSLNTTKSYSFEEIIPEFFQYADQFELYNLEIFKFQDDHSVEKNLVKFLTLVSGFSLNFFQFGNFEMNFRFVLLSHELITSFLFLTRPKTSSHKRNGEIIAQWNLNFHLFVSQRTLKKLEQKSTDFCSNLRIIPKKLSLNVVSVKKPSLVSGWKNRYIQFIMLWLNKLCNYALDFFKSKIGFVCFISKLFHFIIDKSENVTSYSADQISNNFDSTLFFQSSTEIVPWIEFPFDFRRKSNFKNTVTESTTKENVGSHISDSIFLRRQIFSSSVGTKTWHEGFLTPIIKKRNKKIDEKLTQKFSTQFSTESQEIGLSHKIPWFVLMTGFGIIGYLTNIYQQKYLLNTEQFLFPPFSFINSNVPHKKFFSYAYRESFSTSGILLKSLDSLAKNENHLVNRSNFLDLETFYSFENIKKDSFLWNKLVVSNRKSNFFVNFLFPKDSSSRSFLSQNFISQWYRKNWFNVNCAKATDKKERQSFFFPKKLSLSFSNQFENLSKNLGFLTNFEKQKQAKVTTNHFLNLCLQTSNVLNIRPVLEKNSLFSSELQWSKSYLESLKLDIFTKSLIFQTEREEKKDSQLNLPFFRLKNFIALESLNSLAKNLNSISSQQFLSIWNSQPIESVLEQTVFKSPVLSHQNVKKLVNKKYCFRSLRIPELQTPKIFLRPGTNAQFSLPTTFFLKKLFIQNPEQLFIWKMKQPILKGSFSVHRQNDFSNFNVHEFGSPITRLKDSKFSYAVFNKSEKGIEKSLVSKPIQITKFALNEPYNVDSINMTNFDFQEKQNVSLKYEKNFSSIKELDQKKKKINLILKSIKEQKSTDFSSLIVQKDSIVNSFITKIQQQFATIRSILAVYSQEDLLSLSTVTNSPTISYRILQKTQHKKQDDVREPSNVLPLTKKETSFDSLTFFEPSSNKNIFLYEKKNSPILIFKKDRLYNKYIKQRFLQQKKFKTQIFCRSQKLGAKRKLPFVFIRSQQKTKNLKSFKTKHFQKSISGTKGLKRLKLTNQKKDRKRTKKNGRRKEKRSRHSLRPVWLVFNSYEKFLKKRYVCLPSSFLEKLKMNLAFINNKSEINFENQYNKQYTKVSFYEKHIKNSTVTTSLKQNQTNARLENNLWKNLEEGAYEKSHFFSFLSQRLEKLLINQRRYLIMTMLLKDDETEQEGQDEYARESVIYAILNELDSFLEFLRFEVLYRLDNPFFFRNKQLCSSWFFENLHFSLDFQMDPIEKEENAYFINLKTHDAFDVPEVFWRKERNRQQRNTYKITKGIHFLNKKLSSFLNFGTFPRNHFVFSSFSSSYSKQKLVDLDSSPFQQRSTIQNTNDKNNWFHNILFHIIAIKKKQLTKQRIQKPLVLDFHAFKNKEKKMKNLLTLSYDRMALETVNFHPTFSERFANLLFFENTQTIRQESRLHDQRRRFLRKKSQNKTSHTSLTDSFNFPSFLGGAFFQPTFFSSVFEEKWNLFFDWWEISNLDGIDQSHLISNASPRNTNFSFFHKALNFQPFGLPNKSLVTIMTGLTFSCLTSFLFHFCCVFFLFSIPQIRSVSRVFVITSFRIFLTSFQFFVSFFNLISFSDQGKTTIFEKLKVSRSVLDFQELRRRKIPLFHFPLSHVQKLTEYSNASSSSPKDLNLSLTSQAWLKSSKSLNSFLTERKEFLANFETKIRQTAFLFFISHSFQKIQHASQSKFSFSGVQDVFNVWFRTCFVFSIILLDFVVPFHRLYRKTALRFISILDDLLKSFLDELKFYFLFLESIQTEYLFNTEFLIGDIMFYFFYIDSGSDFMGYFTNSDDWKLRHFFVLQTRFLRWMGPFGFLFEKTILDLIETMYQLLYQPDSDLINREQKIETWDFVTKSIFTKWEVENKQIYDEYKKIYNEATGNDLFDFILQSELEKKNQSDVEKKKSFSKQTLADFLNSVLLKSVFKQNINSQSEVFRKIDGFVNANDLKSLDFWPSMQTPSIFNQSLSFFFFFRTKIEKILWSENTKEQLKLRVQEKKLNFQQYKNNEKLSNQFLGSQTENCPPSLKDSSFVFVFSQTLLRLINQNRIKKIREETSILNSPLSQIDFINAFLQNSSLRYAQQITNNYESKRWRANQYFTQANFYQPDLFSIEGSTDSLGFLIPSNIFEKRTLLITENQLDKMTDPFIKSLNKQSKRSSNPINTYSQYIANRFLAIQKMDADGKQFQTTKQIKFIANIGETLQKAYNIHFSKFPKPLKISAFHENDEISTNSYSEITNLILNLYVGSFSKQPSKNVLVVGDKKTNKSLLIQAIAGETEYKLITETAKRYTYVSSGFPFGIRMLKNVFIHFLDETPCLFLLEDIHLIGQRRPSFLADDPLPDDPLFYDNRTRFYEDNLMYYFLSRYKFAKKMNYLSSTEITSTDTEKNQQIDKKSFNSFSIDSIAEGYPLTLDLHWENEELNPPSYIDLKTSVEETNIFEKKSFLELPKTKDVFPYGTSPLIILILKKQKEFNPKKIVKELPWYGIPEDQLMLREPYSYLIRRKVKLLVLKALDNVYVKMFRIIDLLLIIDSLRSHTSFILFATTHLPSILDPALKRDGRFDQTITFSFGKKNQKERWQTPRFQKHETLLLNDYNIQDFTNSRSCFENTFLNLNWSESVNSSQKLAYMASWSKLFDFMKLEFNNFSDEISKSKIQLIKKYWHHSLSQVEGEVPSRFTNIESFESNKITFNNPTLAYFQIAHVLMSKMTLKPKFKHFRERAPFQKKNQIRFFFKKSLIYKLQKNTCLKTSSELLHPKTALHLKTLFTITNSIDFKVYKPIKPTFFQTEELRLSKSNVFELEQKMKDTSLSSYQFEKTLVDPFVLTKRAIEKPPNSPLSLLIFPSYRFENFKRAERDSQGNLFLSLFQKMGLQDSKKRAVRFAQLSGEPVPTLSSQKTHDEKKLDVLLNVTKGKTRLSEVSLNYSFKQPLKSIVKTRFHQNSPLHSAIPETLQIRSVSRTPKTLSAANWLFQKKILVRLSDHLNNQWWNGQFAEYKNESTYAGFIEWRYQEFVFFEADSKKNGKTFLFESKSIDSKPSDYLKKFKTPKDQSIITDASFPIALGVLDFYDFFLEKQISDPLLQDQIMDREIIPGFMNFPDSEQYYNPKQRRWMINHGYWSFWFDLEMNFSNNSLGVRKSFQESKKNDFKNQVSPNLLKDNRLNKNREILDLLVYKLVTTGVLNEIDFQFD